MRCSRQACLQRRDCVSRRARPGAASPRSMATIRSAVSRDAPSATSISTRAEGLSCLLAAWARIDLALSEALSAMAKDDPAAAEVVGRELELDPVAWVDSDPVSAHLRCRIPERLMAVVEGRP